MMYLLIMALVAVICVLLERLSKAEHPGQHMTEDQTGKTHWVKDRDES